jgi:hypothetical protein
MKALRSAACVVLAAASMLVLPAHASSYSTDQSDLWWTDPPGSESGWGIQLVQRSSTIFATMFIYGTTGAPTWYVATMTPIVNGGFVWSGDLYSTTGPWFGTVPYNPANFAATNVGTMSWTPATVTTGTLAYTVNGIAVTKNVTRETLVSENYSGHFGGGFHTTATGCVNATLNGTVENIGLLDIAQSGTTVTVTNQAANGGSCTYNGVLTQSGQMGTVVGTFLCSNGDAGSFTAYELQVSELSIIGRFTASSSTLTGCQATGWFGGLTVTTF